MIFKLELFYWKTGTKFSEIKNKKEVGYFVADSQDNLVKRLGLKEWALNIGQGAYNPSIYTLSRSQEMCVSITRCDEIISQEELEKVGKKMLKEQQA